MHQTWLKRRNPVICSGGRRRLAIDRLGAQRAMLRGWLWKCFSPACPVADLQVAMEWYGHLFGRAPDVFPNSKEVMWNVAGNGWLHVIEDPSVLDEPW